MKSKWGGGALQLYNENEPEVTGTYFRPLWYDTSTGIIAIKTDYSYWYIKFADIRDDAYKGRFDGGPGTTEIDICKETGFSLRDADKYIILYAYNAKGEQIAKIGT